MIEFLGTALPYLLWFAIGYWVGKMSGTGRSRERVESLTEGGELVWRIDSNWDGLFYTWRTRSGGKGWSFKRKTAERAVRKLEQPK